MNGKIGMMIREARKHANMTQGELGELIGKKVPAVCELEQRGCESKGYHVSVSVSAVEP